MATVNIDFSEELRDLRSAVERIERKLDGSGALQSLGLPAAWADKLALSINDIADATGIHRSTVNDMAATVLADCVVRAGVSGGRILIDKERFLAWWRANRGPVSDDDVVVFDKLPARPVARRDIGRSEPVRTNRKGSRT